MFRHRQQSLTAGGERCVCRPPVEFAWLGRIFKITLRFYILYSANAVAALTSHCLFTLMHHYEFAAPPHTDSLAGDEEDSWMIMLEFPVLTQNTEIAMYVYLLFVVHICPASI